MLLVQQKHSSHDSWFSESVRTTFDQNEDVPSAGAYMALGTKMAGLDRGDIGPIPILNLYISRGHRSPNLYCPL